jgi:hypothetical protein
VLAARAEELLTYYRIASEEVGNPGQNRRVDCNLPQRNRLSRAFAAWIELVSRDTHNMFRVDKGLPR